MAGTEKADVVVVGAGPVGLWLGAELRLAGASVLVLDKREHRPEYSRALTVHARTLELFAMRGIVDGWLAEGIRIPTTHFAMLESRLELDVLDSEYPFALSIPQKRTEELIEAHARRLGVVLERGVTATEFAVGNSGVEVRATDLHGSERLIHATYVVGCDGRQSAVRTQAGIRYTGTGDMITAAIGDVRVDELVMPPSLTLHSEHGSFYAVKINAERSRVIAIETAVAPRDTPLTLEDLRRVVVKLTGTDFDMHDPAWLTRAGSATFQADEYRRGRLLLAGDAAHVHFPMGGQGMNLGIQDAFNLGWKLGAVVGGAAPEALLDTYDAERSPVGRAVIENTLAQVAVVSVPGREGMALRNMLDDHLAHNRLLNSTLARFASGIDVHYPPAASDSGLAGLRVPNLVLSDGTRLFHLLRSGRAVAVGLPRAALDTLPESARTRILATDAVPRMAHEPWSRVTSLLVRPDGYAAWSRDGGPADEDGARSALARLFLTESGSRPPARTLAA